MRTLVFTLVVLLVLLWAVCAQIYGVWKATFIVGACLAMTAIEVVNDAAKS